MSNQLNRQILKVNQRTGITQHFEYVEPQLKGRARSGIAVWANPGRGVQGESSNSSDANGFKQIINKRRKPM